MSTSVGKMKIQYNDKFYKRGTISNPLYTYEIKENKKKPSKKDPSKGTWETTRLTYHFSNGEKAVIEVTPDIQDFVNSSKRFEDNRIRRNIRSRGADDMNNEEKNSCTLLSLDQIAEPKDDSDPIQTYAENHTLREQFYNAINQLPKKQQAVVRLKYFEDMSTTEIAMYEQVSVSAISKREAEALNNLKKIYFKLNNHPKN